MGLTIHYSNGKAKNREKINECIEFLKDTATRLPCNFDIIDETFSGILNDWRNPKNPHNGKLVTVHEKGILLWLDEGSEPLTVSFDYDTLEFCNYLKPRKDSELNKCGFFCKTQYAKNFLSTHHTACRLLEFIREKYVSGLKVEDDAKYFGNWDKKHLKKVYEEWSGIISSFGKALDKLKITPGSNIKDIEKSIKQAAQEVHKDEKLKKLFKE